MEISQNQAVQINSTNDNSRNLTFDIAKGLGIVIIVLTHIIASQHFSFYFLLLFRVSLFFVISGYFFKHLYCENLENLKIFIKKKIKTIYLPFVLTNLGCILFHNFFFKIHLLTNNPLYSNMIGYREIYSGITIIKKVLYNFVMYEFEVMVIPIWFLSALFWISICFCIGSFLLNKLIKKDRFFEPLRALIVLLCLGLGFYCYKTGFNFYRIGTMLSCATPFYIGVLYRKYAANLSLNIYTLIISFLILVICNVFNPKHFELVHNNYNNPFWLIITSIFGFIFIISISEFIKKKNEFLSKLFNYIGQNTVIILCLHILSFKLVNVVQILFFGYTPSEKILSSYLIYNPHNDLWCLAYLLAGIFVPCMIKEIYLRIKNALV